LFGGFESGLRTRSAKAERLAGLGVVLAIFVSACVAGVFAIEKIINPHAPTHLLALGTAGAIGFAGNEIAAQIRLGAGRRLDSPALVADGAPALGRRRWTDVLDPWKHFKEPPRDADASND
jgi:divalent metal cation (Fe/Co/Zn/Cd) transporter